MRVNNDTCRIRRFGSVNLIGEGAGLENRACRNRPWGFDSLRFRHKRPRKLLIPLNYLWFIVGMAPTAAPTLRHVVSGRCWTTVDARMSGRGISALLKPQWAGQPNRANSQAMLGPNIVFARSSSFANCSTLRSYVVQRMPLGLSGQSSKAPFGSCPIRRRRR